MNILVSAFALLLMAAGGAQAAVVHWDYESGVADLGTYDNHPLIFAGYTGAYDQVEVQINLTSLEFMYVVSNRTDTDAIVPVNAGIAVEVGGVLADQLTVSRRLEAYVPANSYVWGSAVLEMSRTYTFSTGPDLERFSEPFLVLSTGLSYALGYDDEWSSGMSVAGFGEAGVAVSVKYMLSDPLPEVPVPAPALLLLSGLGGAAAFVRRRRR